MMAAMAIAWGFLKSISAKVWAWLAIAAAALLALFKVYAAGRAAERAATNEKNAEVKDAQLDAALHRPNSDAELDRRLRDGKF